MSYDDLFAGSDYEPARDDARLLSQQERVYECMKDGEWRTLEEIRAITGDPPASISAQLRHLRKEKHGGHIVEKEHRGNGLYAYRVSS